MRDVRMAHNIEEAHQSIAKDRADVLLCNINGEKSRAHSLMSEIRHMG